MSYQSLTRTAPGWEERSAVLLASGARMVDDSGPSLRLRPGFARLALLLDVTSFGGGAGLQVWVQHSPDGARWSDIAAFETVHGAEAQVAWVEAQPALSGSIAPATDGVMAAGTVHAGFVLSRLRVRWVQGGAVAHTFGVELVAIYERGIGR